MLQQDRLTKKDYVFKRQLGLLFLNYHLLGTSHVMDEKTNQEPPPETPPESKDTVAKDATQTKPIDSKESNINEFEKISPEDTLSKLGVKSDSGLSSDEVKKRLEQYGPNALDEKKQSKWLIFLSFFWGPIPWMIEIAIILSAILERWPDLIMIGALLLINAFLGFYQEAKAGNAIQALKNSLALKGRVLRDGQWNEIDAKDLVPGDILQIKLGNIIPADVKLLAGEYLSVDQSALTGESLPVDKAVGDMAYSGTIAKLGEMNAVATATGMNTFFGKTAKLVDAAKTKSHFQQAISKIGRFLIYATLGICAIILVVSLYRMGVSHTDHGTVGQIIIFLLVLVIAGIPVALPAVLSVTMAIGASRLAKLKAIVTKLIAIEELAGLEILCSDKTGTLTKNELTVGDIQVHGAKDIDEIVLYASLASKQEGGDVIDGAVLSCLKDKEQLKNFTVEKFIPFDPVKKRTEATITSSDGKTIKACKGAPQIILDLCHPDQAVSDQVERGVEELASRGFRTLGVAKVDGDGENWQFLGLIPLFDPPRDDTKETIDHLRDMGLSVKMVTGDNAAIAIEIAKTLGLGTNIISVGDLQGDNTKKALLTKSDGFAEVFPEHKYEIVKSFQEDQYIVCMTGDGVNDAPALKQADVGIAVSGATDAARAAADLVLTEPGLMVISHAIEEARRVFGRMKSYAMYRISETCRLLLFLLLAMIIFNDHPLTAIMIILIALLNDIPIMMIAYDNIHIDKYPVSWNMKEIFTIAVGLAVVGVISTFLLYWVGYRYWHLTFEECRTLAFMALLCGGNLTIYLTRNLGFVWHKPHPEGKFFLATLFSLVVGTLASVYGFWSDDFVGIGWKYVGYSWIYILVWFFLCALTKMSLYKIIGHTAAFQEDFHTKMATELGTKIPSKDS